MKVIIAGYGRMGQLIEQTLLAEEGASHEIVTRIDIQADPDRLARFGVQQREFGKCRRQHFPALRRAQRKITDTDKTAAVDGVSAHFYIVTAVRHIKKQNFPRRGDPHGAPLVPVAEPHAYRIVVVNGAVLEIIRQMVEREPLVLVDFAVADP